jgi:uncharacterized protein YjbI with pentapeptide repeats
VASRWSVQASRPKGHAYALTPVVGLVLLATACSGTVSTRSPPQSGMTRSSAAKSAGGAHGRYASTARTTAADDTCTDPGPVNDHGGPVESNPRVYVDFWGWRSDPAGERPYLLSFLSAVGGSRWLSTVRQYCVGDDLRLAGSWDSGGVPPRDPTNADIQAEARATVRHLSDKGLPVPNAPDIQIIVALPLNVSLPESDDEDCAYHQRLEGRDGTTSAHALVVTVLPYLSGGDFGPQCGAFAVNPGSRGALDGVSITEGHELAESITDPEGNAWHDSGHPTEEIADRCATHADYDIEADAHTFAVQQLWSNQADTCAVVDVPPDLPGSVRAVGVDGHIDVSWEAPADDGGTPITGWTATASPGTSTCAVPATHTSCVLADVRNGASYSVEVSASNVAGAGPPSVPDRAVPSTTQDCNFVGPFANLQGCRGLGPMAGADLNGADLVDAGLAGGDLRRTDLRDADLAGADLHDADASGANLFGANLAGADLGGADLRGGDFTSSNLAGATMANSDLMGVISSGITSAPSTLPARWSLVSGYLIGPGANLEDAELSFAGLPSADLAGANLVYADLISANLHGADLAGADLSGANVSDADLQGADVSDAVWTTADPFELACPDGNIQHRRSSCTADP